MISLRSFSWKSVLMFFGFVAALSAWTWSAALFERLTVEQHVVHFLGLFQRNLLNFFPAFVMVGLADGLPLQGAPRRFTIGAALVTGMLLSVQVRCAVNSNQLLYAYESIQLPYCVAFPTLRTYVDFAASWITPLTIAGVVTIMVLARRRDKELAESLHQARSRVMEARRQRAESQLEAMQSRVDPDGLLDTLRAIRARYEANLDEGEMVLDRLIDDLREAARHPSLAQAAE